MIPISVTLYTVVTLMSVRIGFVAIPLPHVNKEPDEVKDALRFSPAKTCANVGLFIKF